MHTEVFLIRHGIAVERQAGIPDRDRPLTEKGRDRTQQVAQRLGELGCHFDALLTSPLVRAYQTAEILVTAGLAPDYALHSPLAPDGELHHWLDWLADWQGTHSQGTLALVGHEPDLTTWGQRLLGATTTSHWQLKKAGIIGLQVPAADIALGNSLLFWLTSPRWLL